MNKSVVVVAVSVDARHVILFSPDGSSVTLVQGDPRITNIMAAVKEPLSEVPPRPVEVSLEMPRPIMENPEFGEAEQASGGVIRFFKVAKKRIADWFKDEPEPAPAVADPAPSAYVSPQTLGVVPGSEVEPAEEVTLEPGNYDVLLTSFLAGNSVPVIKAIRIACGTGLKEAKDLTDASKPVLPADLKPVKDTPANKAENLTPVKPKVENVKKETKAQTAQRLYDEFKGAATSTTAGTKAAELLAFKKASKKSWTALGLSDDIGELVTEKATSVAPKVAVKTVSGFDDLKAKAPKAGSPKAQMAEVLKGSKINVEIANKALAIKRSAKKSWAVLGVSDEVAKMIESLTK